MNKYRISKFKTGSSREDLTLQETDQLQIIDPQEIYQLAQTGISHEKISKYLGHGHSWLYAPEQSELHDIIELARITIEIDRIRKAFEMSEKNVAMAIFILKQPQFGGWTNADTVSITKEDASNIASQIKSLSDAELQERIAKYATRDATTRQEKTTPEADTGN